MVNRYRNIILLVLLQFTSLWLIAQPKANFTVSSVSGCSPLTETFTDATTGGTGPYTYSWNLGNSNNSSSQDPSAVYYLPGNYNITLIVTDKKGNIDSITKTITVLKNPTAKFSAAAQVGCAPFKVYFSDQSMPGSSKLAQWLWDFGDGSTSTSQNPVYHIYSNPGTYAVSLEVTDANGCTGSIIMPAYIYVDDPPVATISASQTIGCTPPLTVNFSSKVTASGTVSYLWNFGDGNTSTSPSPTNKYISKGSYTVSLTVTDSLGCTSTVTMTDYIYVGKPVASFNYSAPGGCAPLSVTFTSTSTGVPNGSTFYWIFGDGQTGNGSSATHFYSPGDFTVKLVVTSPGGCSDTAVMHQLIHASTPYKASFSTDSILCDFPFTGIFTNTSGANTKVLSWDFGDKTSVFSTPNTVYHTFPDSNGQYTVKLTVTDQNGCTEIDSEPSVIKTGSTIALFKEDTIRGCVPLTDTFTNQSTSIDPIVSYLWDFGDGTTSNLYNPPPHTYSKEGTFKVKLLIKTKHYCAAEDSVIIFAGVPPQADFTAYPDSGCLNMLRHVDFINLTNSHGYAVVADSFVWGFGANILPNNPLNISNVAYNDTPGRYNVTLIAFNNHACPDTFTIKKLITIAPPWAQYTVQVDTCSLQNRVSFKDKSIGAARVEYYFGDGDSSSLRNPTHVYANTGLFYPFEVAYDSSNGCSDTFSYFSIRPLKGLYIKPPWQAYIKPISPTSGCAPLTVYFELFSNDTATIAILYGDGTDTVAQVTGIMGTELIGAQHTYAKPGAYQVTMTAIDIGGCIKDSAIKPDIVVDDMQDGFIESPVKGCVPLTVTLTDTSSGSIPFTQAIYDMGNGETVKITSKTMTYTYKAPPANQAKGFQISQIISNGYCHDTVRKTVYPYQPSGQISEFNLSTCDSVYYEFYPAAKGHGTLKYLWVFGKGDTSANIQPGKSYTPGSYTVQLKITDSMGCIDTVSVPINVPVTKDSANFAIKLSQGHCPPVTANFIDESKFSVPDGHQWAWDFGDGSPVSTLQNPTRVYYKSGNYTITLKIKDALGCTSTATKPNQILVDGATGEYSFDTKTGCAPVTVHFVSQSADATKFEWDFGDGSIDSSDTATHIYRNPGTYIPLLLLGDKSGCLYALPPIDTINVYPIPKADFGYDSTCSGQPITLTDMSTTSKGTIVRWVWDFGDGTRSTLQSPTHIYKQNGFYPVKLSVTNNAGCTDSVMKSVKYGDIIAALSASKTGCLNVPAQFKDLTQSDSTIKSWLWLFGDGSSSTLQNPTHVYTTPGVFPISLYVENYKGCFDSLKNGAYIIIGDTIAPKPPIIYRVTVADDHTIEVDFNKDNDYDFEKYMVYIRDENGSVKPVDSIFNASDTIKMEGGLNNLHHSYCVMIQAVSVCGYKSDTIGYLYHCTINLDAKPGVNEALLSWTPYIGWPVSQYKIYRQGMEIPPQFSILDSVPGSQLKYVDTTVVCFHPMVYRAEGIEQGGYRQWSWSDTAATIPIHIPRVPPANMVRATVVNNKNTMVVWQAVPNAHTKNWMLEKSIDGINFQVIDTPIVASVDSETDQKVNVQTSSYTYRLRILDSCGDLGPYSNIGKTILLNIDTTADVKPQLVWSGYRDWPEGVQYYDIDIENAKNSFNWLAKTTSGTDTQFVDNITDLNSLPFYTYHVVAHRNGTLLNPNQNINITSISNDATLKPHPRLFVPNVFTPNGDGLNDSFFVEGLFISEFHIKIFDRWGTKVFESGSMKEKWDGRFKNGPPILDSYKYLIYYRGVDNIDQYVSGWVTILL